MPRAAEHDLEPSGTADEQQAQLVRGARGPHPGKVAGELVHAKGRMPFVRIEQLQSLREPPPVRSAERREGLQEFRSEAKGRKLRDGSAPADGPAPGPLASLELLGREREDATRRDVRE